MLKYLFSTLTILFSVILSAQPEKLQTFDYGTLENHTYTNEQFDLKVDVTPEWVIQTDEQVQHLLELGAELTAGDDKQLRAIVDASKVNSAPLLTAFKYEVGSPVDYNSNFAIGVENLKYAPGVKKGSDYLFHVKKLLARSQLNYNVSDEGFGLVLINKIPYYSMGVSVEIMGKKIFQRYYARVHSGFAIGFVMSYQTEEQENEILQMLKISNP